MAYCSQCARYEAEIARLTEERDAAQQMAKAAMELARDMHPPKQRDLNEFTPASM